MQNHYMKNCEIGSLRSPPYKKVNLCINTHSNNASSVSLSPLLHPHCSDIHLNYSSNQSMHSYLHTSHSIYNYPHYCPLLFVHYINPSLSIVISTAFTINLNHSSYQYITVRTLPTILIPLQHCYSFLQTPLLSSLPNA